jgi:hypothetical protein
VGGIWPPTAVRTFRLRLGEAAAATAATGPESAERQAAEKMLRDCLSDEPEWEAILEVVPVEFEISPN